MMTSMNGQNQTTTARLSNAAIARHLEEVAELLEAQRANPYRVRAYRMGAETVRGLEAPVRTILEAEGVEGLIRLPNIGVSLARSIEQLDQSSQLSLLERLRGETRPEHIFTTVPGIGDKLARLIHDKLDIETLAELQAAAYDGRLAQVPGFGRRRLRGVRESLAGRFAYRGRPIERGRSAERASPARQSTASREGALASPVDLPPVAELLDIDREYREKARAGQLPKIAPRRFNPTQQAWLPILHTERGSTHYTALYSNTARAHELNMIHDWVVIYRDDHDGSGQWTIITSQFGPLRGKRIVRGREAECAAHYKPQAIAA